MAEDYFSAMQKVEQRLDIVPTEQEENIEVVNVQEKMFQLIGRLEMPELCFEERINITCQLCQAFSNIYEHAPPNEHYEVGNNCSANLAERRAMSSSINYSNLAFFFFGEKIEL